MGVDHLGQLLDGELELNGKRKLGDKVGCAREHQLGAQDGARCRIGDDLRIARRCVLDQAFAVGSRNRLAALHLEAGFFGLRLGKADARNIGAHVHAAGNHVHIDGQLLAADGRDDVARLGACNMRELDVACFGVADDPQMLLVGGTCLVGNDAAVDLGLPSAAFGEQAVELALASGCGKHAVNRKLLLGALLVQVGERHLAGLALDFLDVHLGFDLHTDLLAEHGHALRDFLVHGRKNAVGHFKNVDLESQVGVQAGNLHADDAAADDGDRLEFRRIVFKKVVGGVHAGAVDAGDGHQIGHRAACDNNIGCFVDLAVAADLLLACDGGVAFHHGDLVGLHHLGDACAQLLDDFFFACVQGIEVVGNLLCADAQVLARLSGVVELGGMDERLGGDAPAVQASAAQVALFK